MSMAAMRLLEDEALVAPAAECLPIEAERLRRPALERRQAGSDGGDPERDGRAVGAARLHALQGVAGGRRIALPELDACQESRRRPGR